MNSRATKKDSIATQRAAFTLFEMLVAVAIIGAVLAMVWGTYFAASSSTQKCRDKIELTGKAVDLLEQISRQVRCAYAPVVNPQDQIQNPTAAAPLPSEQQQPVYFRLSSQSQGQVVLQMVSTYSSAFDRETSDGLFECAYRFDKDTGQLLYAERRFTGQNLQGDNLSGWRAVLQNVTQFDLAAYDAGQWARQWGFAEKGKMPNAVKIKIVCEDEEHRTYEYETVAHIADRGLENQNDEQKSRVAVNKL